MEHLLVFHGKKVASLRTVMLYFSILASGSRWQEYVIVGGGLSLQIEPAGVTTWRSLLPDETGAVNDGVDCETIRVGETAPPSE